MVKVKKRRDLTSRMVTFLDAEEKVLMGGYYDCKRHTPLPGVPGAGKTSTERHQPLALALRSPCGHQPHLSSSATRGEHSDKPQEGKRESRVNTLQIGFSSLIAVPEMGGVGGHLLRWREPP